MKKSAVIQYFDKATNVAKLLGVSDSSINQWGDIIPEKQALKLERLTGGKLKYDPKLYMAKAS